MDRIPLYHLLHAVGIMLTFIGIARCALPETRKSAMKFHGTGLLILLISGFGNHAALGLSKAGVWPTWFILKLVIFLVLGVLPVLVKRGKLPAQHSVLVALLCGVGAAFLGTLGKTLLP
jgi:hypothetical protein